MYTLTILGTSLLNKPEEPRQSTALHKLAKDSRHQENPAKEQVMYHPAVQ